MSINTRRDEVDDVLDKIPGWLKQSFDQTAAVSSANSTTTAPHNDASWIDQLRAELRLLQARAPVGSLLGKHDTQVARVVALLGCRKCNTATTASRGAKKTPRQVLAKSVGMSTKTLDQLCAMVERTLHTPAIRPVTRASLKREKLSDGASTLENSTLPSQLTIKSVIIPELAIQLGNWVPDSEGVARRAQQLLEEIEHFISTSVSIHLRSGYAYELQTHQSVYEAACFYLVTKQDGTAKTTSTSNRLRKSTILRTSREADDDDENENMDEEIGTSVRPLELIHLLEALSSCSSTGYVDLKMLKNVVGFVTKLMTKMEKTEALHKSDSNKVPATTTKDNATVNPSSRKRYRSSSKTCRKMKKAMTERQATDDHHHVLQSVLDQIHDADTTISGASASKDVSVATNVKNSLKTTNVWSPEFLEWKEKAMAEARLAAIDVIGKDDLSDREVFMHAANSALQRQGLFHLLL